MSESNPFTFNGLNVPGLPFSETSLRSELARSKQSNASLHREIQDLKDANGLARALAAAKKGVQEAQREVKRAQIAERVAREALTSVNDTRRMEEEERNKLESSEDVEMLRKQLVESRTLNGNLHDELETCKDDLANVRRRLDEANQTFDDRLRTELEEVTKTIVELQKQLYEATDQIGGVATDYSSYDDALQDYKKDFEETFHAELEEAKKSKETLEIELQQVSARLRDARTDLQRLEEHTGEAAKEVEALRKRNAELEKTLEFQKNIEIELSETNESLAIDLNTKKAERNALADDRNDLEVQLAEVMLALKDSRESEAEAHNELEQLKAETELAVNEISEHVMGLQADIDTNARFHSDHEHTVAVKDARIEHLEHEIEALKEELENRPTYTSNNQDVDRPAARRNISMLSQKSISEELEGLSDADFEEDVSVDAHSDFEEPANSFVDLQLSNVREIVSLVPQKAPAPALTVSVNDAVFTMPERRDSGHDYSPISDISSIDPIQPAAPRLTLHDSIVADLQPFQSAAPTCSLFHNAVGCISPTEPIAVPLAHSVIHPALDYAPVDTISMPSKSPAPTLSLSEHTVQSSSPSEPKLTPLRLSSISSSLDCAPIERVNHPAELTALTLSLSDLTLRSVRPSEPRLAPLYLSSVDDILDYNPIEPVISVAATVNKASELSMCLHETLSYPPVEPSTLNLHAAPEHQTLSIHLTEDAGFNIDPVDGSIIIKRYRTNPVEFKFHHMASKSTRKDKGDRKNKQSRGSDRSSQSPVPTHELTIDPERRVSVANSDSTILIPLKRSPIDSVLGLSKLSDPDTLDQLSAQWPVADGEPLKKTMTAYTPRATPAAAPVTAEGKGSFSFFHWLWHPVLVPLIAYCWVLSSKLSAWESANGVGFGEGYGGAMDRHDSYGNYILLHMVARMLPQNLLSADSPLPFKAVEVITSTKSAVGPMPAY
ncbi:hypothetical protein SLS59_005009 [Nothophoma quercina]|uniref:Uncharacterized protein n=1 Tax=Nothophoma quercina TaxID=749835 RepID=A0ABR3RCZ5_9PLEO